MKNNISIFAATRRAYRALNDKLMAATDLRATDYEILRFIVDNPGSLRANIAKQTGIDLPSVSRIVKQFADRGWIEGDGSQLHYVPVRMTAKGAKAHAELSLVGYDIEHEIGREIRGSMKTFIRNLSAIAKIQNQKPATNGTP